MSNKRYKWRVVVTDLSNNKEETYYPETTMFDEQEAINDAMVDFMLGHLGSDIHDLEADCHRCDENFTDIE